MEITLNLLAIFSIIATLFSLYRVYTDMKKDKCNIKTATEASQRRLSDYEKIVKRTYSVEHDRQKNKGIHYKECTYLNRAEIIRTQTNFFSFVNQE